jgi:ADP-ribose pyrophosphatase YjhB (NUDIX family)
MNDYIKTMRQLIGHETLFTVGCGAIIEDNQKRILLQRRRDQNNWCLPGGVMEVNETFEETVKREVEEETGLTLEAIELFGIYSGPSCFKQYPNGDKVYSVQIIFICRDFKGDLKQEGEESFEHRFFDRSDLPEPLNSNQASFILDWAEGRGNKVIVK